MRYALAAVANEHWPSSYLPNALENRVRTDWNGTPTYRISVTGTKRLLGVSEGRFRPNGYELLPLEIPQPTNFDSEYFGDFTVCPFEPEQPKRMRLVCVSAVNHLRIVDRKK